MGTHFCRLGKYAFSDVGGHLTRPPRAPQLTTENTVFIHNNAWVSKCYIGGTHGTPTVYHRGIRLSNRVHQ